MFNPFIALISTSLFFSVSFVNGSLGVPKLYPIIFNASLTGIGLTSENKALIKGILSNWNFLASSVFPI